MVKEQLYKARELIKQKRYSEARKLLRTLNDPVAVKWLKQLDAIAPEGQPQKANPKTKLVNKPTNKPAGRGWITLVALLVVLVLVGGSAFFLLTQGENPMFAIGQRATHTPSITPGGPTLTPTFTPQPTATSTPFPCEAQLYWNTNAGLVQPFFQTTLKKDPENHVAYLEYSTSPDRMIQLRDRFSAATPPDCDELTTFHENTRQMMDYVIALGQSNVGRKMLTLEDFVDLEIEDVYRYSNLAMDMFDSYALVIRSLDDMGVTFDETAAGMNVESGVILDYLKSNSAECPKVRWMIVEYNTLSVQVLKLIKLVTDMSNENKARSLIYDMSDERRRVKENEYPSCVGMQHRFLVDSYNKLILMLQNAYTNGDLYAQYLSINDAAAAMLQLDAAMRHIDGLKLLEGTDFWGNPRA